MVPAGQPCRTELDDELPAGGAYELMEVGDDKLSSPGAVPGQYQPASAHSARRRGSLYGPPVALKAHPTCTLLHAAMLEPLARFVVPVGQLTATALAL